MIKSLVEGKPECAAAPLRPRASFSFYLSGRTSFKDNLTLKMPELSGFPSYLIFLIKNKTKLPPTPTRRVHGRECCIASSLLSEVVAALADTSRFPLLMHRCGFCSLFSEQLRAEQHRTLPEWLCSPCLVGLTNPLSVSWLSQETWFLRQNIQPCR